MATIMAKITIPEKAPNALSCEDAFCAAVADGVSCSGDSAASAGASFSGDSSDDCVVPGLQPSLSSASSFFASGGGVVRPSRAAASYFGAAGLGAVHSLQIQHSGSNVKHSCLTLVSLHSTHRRYLGDSIL